MATNLKAKYAEFLKSPRVTEKASLLLEGNVYTFEISEKASKKDIADAVKTFYNVSPLRVNIAKTPAKQVFMRGKKGNKSGVRKAYVLLKKGDTINAT